MQKAMKNAVPFRSDGRQMTGLTPWRESSSDDLSGIDEPGVAQGKARLSVADIG
jgi:hypothetical protein